MTRIITVTIERDEDESIASHELDCITTVRGRYYHDCLKNIGEILITYDKKNKLNKDSVKLLEELKKQIAPYLKEVKHG